MVTPPRPARDHGMSRDSLGRSKLMLSPRLPLPFSRYGATMIPSFGSARHTAGEMAAMGSFRYWRRSSSATGSVEKYENLFVSGIRSPPKRAASSSTGNFEAGGSVDIRWFRL